MFEGESPLRMTGSAEGGRRAGVNEDVVFLDVQGGPFIEIGHRTGAARSAAAASGSVADELHGGDGAVLLRANAKTLVGAGTIADREMFLLAVKHEPHRSSCFAGERGGNDSRIARAKLGAKAASHKFRDDAHLGLGQMKEGGELFADAGGSLGRGVDR